MFLEHALLGHLYRLEDLMTEMNDDQKRLDADVAALKQAFADEVAALKSQINTEPQRPANSLDFSGLEDLVNSVKTETTPPAAAVQSPPTPTPSDHPSLLDTNVTAPTAIGPTAPSPFVDTDNDGDTAGENDGDAEAATSGGSTNDQVPAQSSEATSTPATDAASVAAPANDVTPSTEGQSAPADVNAVDPSGKHTAPAEPTPAEGDSGHSGASA
jgi:hypothetical protein